MCRTANGGDINFDKNYYKKLINEGIEKGHIDDYFLSSAQKDGRGNICPVTIIMPTLAMMAKEEFNNRECDNGETLVDTFMKILDTKIHEAKDQLLERFEWIASQSPKAATFMYENKTMAGYVPEEGIRSALCHGTIVVG